MLDLQPIKARLAAATQLPNPPYVHLAVAKKADVQLVDNCQADLKALVAEVERLRGAIATHKRRVVIDPQPWDRDLWEVLE